MHRKYENKFKLYNNQRQGNRVKLNLHKIGLIFEPASVQQHVLQLVDHALEGKSSAVLFI